MEGFIIVKQFDKKFWLAVYKRYNKQIAVLLLLIAAGTVIYTVLHTNRAVPIESKIADDRQMNDEVNNRANKPDSNLQNTMLYTMLPQNNKLQNPFSFAHETESEARQNNLAEQEQLLNSAAAVSDENTQDNRAATQAGGGNKSESKIIQQGTAGYELTAVLQLQGRKTAVVSANNGNHRLHEGDSLNQFTVEAIAQNSVHLRANDGSKYELRLKGF